MTTRKKGIIVFSLVSLLMNLFFIELDAQPSEDKPNILWISTEDHSPIIGAYGDEYAHTPNLDRLAEQGIVYKNAFVSSPICAPARSGIITGMHATSLGTQNLRSDIKIPDFIKTLPEILIEYGYYTTNNAKTDYNFDPIGRWNESSNSAHWRNRTSNNQPFFSVFNLGVTHEGRANRYHENLFEPLKKRQNPDEAVLPPFFADTEEMRRLWARQYDLVTLADLQMQEILDQLKEDGLHEDTIVFFWSDHGNGLPRYKRWLYSTGLEVALIVYIPPKYRHLVEITPGSESSRLVSLVDLTPTVLSLAGIKSPDYMEGTPFLGEFEEEPRTYLVAHRDRADDVYDMARAVRTEEFMYIRNYMPHLPYIQQSLIFGDEKWSYAELHKTRKEGLLSKHGEAMYRPRDKEELYAVEADPYELNNLVNDPEYIYILKKMRYRLDTWIFETKDTGFLQEGEMMLRSEVSTPYEMVNTPHHYDLFRIKAAAELVGDRTVPVLVLADMLNDHDSGVRYWAVEALLERVHTDAWMVMESLKSILLTESSPSVQIKAAETLCMLEQCSEGLSVLADYLEDDREWLVLQAAISVRQLGGRVEEIVETIHNTRRKFSGSIGSRGYVNWSYPMFIGFALDQALENLN